MSWQIDSWKTFTNYQSIDYPDEDALRACTQQLAQLPPLVSPCEIIQLTTLLTQVSSGDAFIIQGGDCAETFATCHQQAINKKVAMLLLLGATFAYITGKPVIPIGRIAGQFAKSRSALVEVRGDQVLPSYRGDMVNGFDFTTAARACDPKRLLQSYHVSSQVMNYMRVLKEAGYYHLSRCSQWLTDLALAPNDSQIAFFDMVTQIEKNVKWMSPMLSEHLHTMAVPGANIFTSHEALHLPYEQQLTRHSEQGAGGWYDLSCHLPWIGKRTLQADSAHVEFMRGIENPLGIKIGPELTLTDLKTLLLLLNPLRKPGRLVLIHRLGANKICDCLPDYINMVNTLNMPVVWLCDPMHGNTRLLDNGYKTRYLDDIVKEVLMAFSVHKLNKSTLGGLHLEMTPDAVTECVGTDPTLSLHDVPRRYLSFVDPRLNLTQTLTLSMQVAAFRNRKSLGKESFSQF